MILPAFLLLAEMASWIFALDVAQDGNTELTTLCVGIALTWLIWLAIEVWQLSEDFSSRGRISATGPDSDP